MNKILVIDEDYGIRLLYEEELTDDGYDVISSYDCENLHQLISQEKPDIIIMGIRLGKFNGLDLLMDIRNKHYNLPVIICTAYPNFKYDPRSIAADYFVVKSSNLKDLKVKVEMAIQGRFHDYETYVGSGTPQGDNPFPRNEILPD